MIKKPISPELRSLYSRETINGIVELCAVLPESIVVYMMVSWQMFVSCLPSMARQLGRVACLGRLWKNPVGRLDSRFDAIHYLVRRMQKFTANSRRSMWSRSCGPHCSFFRSFPNVPREKCLLGPLHVRGGLGWWKSQGSETACGQLPADRGHGSLTARLPTLELCVLTHRDDGTVRIDDTAGITVAFK